MELAHDARALLDEHSAPGSGTSGFASRRQRLGQTLKEVNEVDFFDADGRKEAEQAMEELSVAGVGEAGSVGMERGSVATDIDAGRLWITPTGVKFDRIASAWLIQRFIDPQARFAFVESSVYEPADGDLRFDMFEGEFSHGGDSCTFETLPEHFGPTDPALRAVACIVHDIDCKDEKSGRPEVAGVASLVNGIVLDTSRHRRPGEEGLRG